MYTLKYLFYVCLIIAPTIQVPTSVPPRNYKLTVSQQRLVIPKGGNGTIECTPEGVPLPRVNWKKADGDFRNGVTQSGNTLIITDARDEDRANYVCEGIVEGTVVLTTYSLIEIGEVTPQPTPEPEPLVRVGTGAVRGLRATDGDYSMFLGVPYATVDPNNRFGPAIPHVLEDEINAFDDTVKCPQMDIYNYTTSGTLDCLQLNIYVPNSASIENPLPVMVYIYGGRFTAGFAGRHLFGPRFLVRHDVILVTVNYRLGPYGFFCLDTPDLPGNQGFKDQAEALRWIKGNIRSFGGDESRITLSGHSAGAMAVDFHAHFTKERLFNRVILQSGVAIANTIFQSDPEAPIKIAKGLNYTAIDINDALSYLNGVDPLQLIAASEKSGVNFGPCVEKKFDGIDGFITTHPINVERIGNLDVLIGITDDEGYVDCAIIDKDTFDQTDFVNNFLNDIFEFRDEKLFSDIHEILTHFYFGDDTNSPRNKSLSIDVYSDFFMNYPTMRTIQKYVKSELENIFFYVYSYNGERSYRKYNNKIPYTEGRAAHADELGYIFDISYFKKYQKSKDMLIVERMTKLWTNFIKYGDPTAPASGWEGPRWTRVSRGRLPYMELGESIRMRARPMQERMALLDLLYHTLGPYERRFRVGGY